MMCAQAIDLDLLDKADMEGIEVASLLNHNFSPSHIVSEIET